MFANASLTGGAGGYPLEDKNSNNYFTKDGFAVGKMNNIPKNKRGGGFDAGRNLYATNGGADVNLATQQRQPSKNNAIYSFESADLPFIMKNRNKK